MKWLAREIAGPAVQERIAEAADLYVNGGGPETGQVRVTLLLDVKDRRILRSAAAVTVKGVGIAWRSARKKAER